MSKALQVPELKPCLRCGGEVVIYRADIARGIKEEIAYNWRCKGCNLSNCFPFTGEGGMENAKADANLRTTTDAVRGEVKAWLGGAENRPLTQAEYEAMTPELQAMALPLGVLPFDGLAEPMRLTDVQWMNIVNFDHAYTNFDKDEAVHLAVKKTVDKLNEIYGHLPPATPRKGEG